MAFNLTVLLTFLYLASHERNVFGASSGKLAEDGPWVVIGKRSFRHYPSVDALSDMQNFFKNLRNNLDYLETVPLEERELLLGKAGPEKEARFRSNSDSYIQALRNERPSYKIRNFVDSSEPASLRGSNRYDPNLLWTGLGRRR